MIGTVSCDGGDLLHIDGDEQQLKIEIVKNGGIAPVPVTIRRESVLALEQMVSSWLGRTR